jgi:hypothetical protein
MNSQLGMLPEGWSVKTGQKTPRHLHSERRIQARHESDNKV